jgi:hypothetical protein
MLQRLHVIFFGILHESTEESYIERQVWSRVEQVAQAPNDVAVLGCVHSRRRTPLGQLQLWLHGRHTPVAPCHACLLKQLLGVCTLTQLDTMPALLHLDAKII